MSAAARSDFSRCAAAFGRLDGAGGARPHGRRLAAAALPAPVHAPSRGYLLVERDFCHGLGHEVLVYNSGVRLARLLGLVHVHTPLLSQKERGDHAELGDGRSSEELDRALNLGGGHEVRWEALRKTPGLRIERLSRPCPVGAKKHVGGGGGDDGPASYRKLRAAVEAAAAKAGSGGGAAAAPVVYRVCGDVSGIPSDGDSQPSQAKYAFAATGPWWRSKLDAAPPTPTALYDPSALNVAIHVRRGDMVYRNFYWQLSPDAYFANAMYSTVALARAAAAASAGAAGGPGAARRVVLHVFTERPPRRSWSGKPKVPLAAARAGAAYVDELGCAARLDRQLAALDGGSSGGGGGGGGGGGWEVRMHVDTDTVATFLHLARADVLIASDSSFSLAAAVLSRGIVLSMGKWRRFPPVATAGIAHPLALRADGTLSDCAAAAAAWRQLQRRTGTLP